jgi:hypothetical protein
VVELQGPGLVDQALFDPGEVGLGPGRPGPHQRVELGRADGTFGPGRRRRGHPVQGPAPSQLGPGLAPWQVTPRGQPGRNVGRLVDLPLL